MDDLNTDLEAGCKEHPLDPLCGRRPEEISEYSPEMTGEDLTPSEYVMSEEGTYDPQTGNFLCSECYIAVGMPTSPGGWTATPDNLKYVGIFLRPN